MLLNTDDLIDIAENGTIFRKFWDDDNQCWDVGVIKLDDTAKIVLHQCLYKFKQKKKYSRKPRIIGGKINE